MASWPDPALTSAAELVERLRLQPHPEGGWYRENHRSGAQVRRQDGATRSALTQIFYLLPGGGLSRWHRVRGSDEVWQFLAGDPLELWTLPPEGGEAQLHRLAPPAGPLGDEAVGPSAVQRPAVHEAPSLSVPAGWWQAARAPGRWSLVSCVVGPGFAFEDFDLLNQLPVHQHPLGAAEAFL
ncbi:cupin domain-containing protein [Cyanobium sp. NIES-981]|uniref:cupin domain-containing protein n=1 Tax=Cyanobium sp. NIES-981 TaxID=1851505 RepID=UPI0007DD9076|nr:cupin domain-containing protein [Cyanobium sp. NIES-981]SBO44639.1 Cupin family protein [Cyanobium sp. NIES-981]